MPDLARRELVKLAKLCALGVSQEWEFNEWYHGVTGRPMGKAYQTWSAASFIRACHDLHLEPHSLERL
jgi:glycogen debranching enzyme